MILTFTPRRWAEITACSNCGSENRNILMRRDFLAVIDRVENRLGGIVGQNNEVT